MQQVVLAPGSDRPDRVNVSIDADLGVAIASVDSPTHSSAEIHRTNDQTVSVAVRDAVPDRDLDVRFHVAGAAPTVSLMASPPADGEAMPPPIR